MMTENSICSLHYILRLKPPSANVKRDPDHHPPRTFDVHQGTELDTGWIVTHPVHRCLNP